jgi:hypothetical protein
MLEASGHRENILDVPFEDAAVAIADDAPMQPYRGPLVVTLYDRRLGITRLSLSHREEIAMLATPNGLAEVIAAFGDVNKFIRSDGTLSPKWEEQKIVRVMLPKPLPLSGTTISVKRITCHTLLAETLKETLRDIDNAGKWPLLHSYGGGFNFRPKRGSAQTSLHSWGIAWDFDPEHNPLGGPSAMDLSIVDIFDAHGFFWGGRFQKRKDPMHFQFAKGV